MVVKQGPFEIVIGIANFTDYGVIYLDIGQCITSSPNPIRATSI